MTKDLLERNATRTADKKFRFEVIALIIAAAAMISVLLLPLPEGLPPQGKRLAALVAAMLVLWSTEALPIAVTAIFAVALLPIFRLTTLGAAVTSFMSPPFFFVLVMFIIAHGWVKTGLARRFALWMISKAEMDATRTVYVFMFGTGLISTFISDVPCAAIFMAVALGIFQKLNLQPGSSSFAKAVMIGIPVGAMIGGVGTPAGSSINILGLGLLEQNAAVRVPFLYWMAIGIPMVLILLPIAAWVLTRFYPPEITHIGDAREIQDERKEIGPINSAEWKVIAIMGAMFVFWIASTWYPAFDTTLVSICGATAMFLPGIKLFTWKEAQEAIGWDTLLMIGGVTSLGAASASTGLAKWLATAILGGLQDWNVLSVLALISAFTVVIHLLLPVNPVIVGVMIPPIVLLAKNAGVNPAVYALPVIFTASCAFLLPLDAVPLVTYSKGYYKMFDMLIPGVVISIAWVIVMTVLLRFIGPMIALL
jgi:solute carrier family 13 (sodium-dependent dicarboxylate transporter), member 2/3/5